PTALLLFTTPRPPRSTPFPYTTLFRSPLLRRADWVHARLVGHLLDRRPAARPDDVSPDQDRDDHEHHDHEHEQEDGIVCGELKVDRKSTRLNSSHRTISYAVFCLKKKK